MATKKKLSEKKLPGGWKVMSLWDAFQPRATREYVVEGLFALSTLSIVFGTEGSMKSLLMMDMGICVSEGLEWLPNENNTGYRFKTKKCNVLYIDCDNGSITDRERINAFAVSHGLAADKQSPFRFIPMPTGLDISDMESIEKLCVYLDAYNIKLLILDNLGLINSEDENSSGMAKVMANLRVLAEHGLCVIVVHHQRKSNGMNARLGEMLRGHSSIAASLDFSYFVSRKDINGNEITIIPTKSRFAPVEMFGAKFLFHWVDGTTDLESATFVGYKVQNEAEKAALLVPVLIGDREITKSQITRELMDRGFTQRVAQNAVEDAISSQLIHTKKGPHNATLLTASLIQVDRRALKSIQKAVQKVL